LPFAYCSKMNSEKKRFIAAVSVLIGTCIGAGVLGIPYVASRAGFFVALGYILLVGIMILMTNLYLGEVSLRTRGSHQLPGYAQKYLGKFGKGLAEFATIFGIYSAIVAYILGIGESLSFLIFGNLSKGFLLGVLFAIFMALLLWDGLKSLKRFEKWGVFFILFLFVLIFFIFMKDIKLENLTRVDFSYIFLPFGVILFAMMAFYAIPEVELILKNNEHLMKRVLVVGTLVPMIFYTLFAFVVVGFLGEQTPEIATFGLGKLFVFLGIFTMFTSYLSLGNALQENFCFDNRMKKGVAWFLASLVPLGIFILTRFSKYFSFTKILGLGGSVSAGVMGILVMLMARRAKKMGNRKPEYSVRISLPLLVLFSLIFLLGILYEFFFR